ncbi:hypothetical protein [Peribacillus muralis]
MQSLKLASKSTKLASKSAELASKSAELASKSAELASNARKSRKTAPITWGKIGELSRINVAHPDLAPSRLRGAILLMDVIIDIAREQRRISWQIGKKPFRKGPIPGFWA